MNAIRALPPRVLVTGAGGFIGSHLAAAQLGRGHRVVGLDLHLERAAHLAPAGLELIEGDVADPAIQARALDGVEVVYNLAAAHLSVSASESEFRRVNVEGQRSLVESAKRAGVRRFVHCSSVGVYGRIASPPADEQTPCHPEIAYERTKLEGERVVLEAHRRTGLPCVVIRPVWVYGPGCSRTEKLFRTIGKGRFLMAGSGRALRHCIYIDDMVEAFHLASIADAAVGQVIVVGDAGAVPVRQLIQEIARLTGGKLPPPVPVALLWAAGLAAEILSKPLRREPPLSRRTLKFFTANTAFDITRARTLLAFEPRYDLAAGLRETHRILDSGTSWKVPLPESAAR